MSDKDPVVIHKDRSPLEIRATCIDCDNGIQLRANPELEYTSTYSVMWPAVVAIAQFVAKHPGHEIKNEYYYRDSYHKGAWYSTDDSWEIKEI